VPDVFINDHVKYLNGYQDGSIKPDANITRAETAAIIYRLLDDGVKKAGGGNGFTDIERGAWYEESVKFLAGMGIVRGYLDGSFMPDNPITRAEYATMISKFDANAAEKEVFYKDTEGHWAEAYIAGASANGWISGYPDGTYKPDNYITRAEVVSSVNRMLHRMIVPEDLPDQTPDYIDLHRDHWAYAAINEASIGHIYDYKFPNTNSILEIWKELMH